MTNYDSFAMHFVKDEFLMPPPHGGDLARARRLFGGEAGDWIDFSNNINPYGLADSWLDDLLARLRPRLREYPDPDYTALRRTLAARHEIDPDALWPVNGSVAGLYGVAQLHDGRHAVVPAPAFREYAHACRAARLTVEEPLCFKPDHESPDWESIVPLDGVIILGTPNSPTGDLPGDEDIARILATARDRRSIVVLDEAFLPFTARAGSSRVAEAAHRDDLIVLRSLTKTHGLPGLRLGYLVSSPPTIARLRAVMPPWGVGPLAEIVTEALPAIESLISGQLDLIREEALHFHARLRETPRLHVYPSAANFFLCETHVDGPTAAALKEQLCRRHLLIRVCDDYPGLSTRHFRVAVRRPEENARLVAALAEVLAA